MKSKKIAMTSMLLTLALLLGIVESLIPPFMPLFPYLRIGLTNIVIFYCLIAIGTKEAYIIAVLKSVFVGIFIGNPIMILYSLPASVLSLFVGIILLNLKKNSLPAISAVSAITHNVVQLIVASLMMQTFLVFSYLPYFILIGSVSGFVIGCIVYFLLRKMPKLT